MTNATLKYLCALINNSHCRRAHPATATQTTMKFSLLVLAGALASTNASSNKLSTTPRRLENDDGANDGYWEDSEVLTANNVMVLEACYTVSSRLDEDMENYDNVYALVKAGKAKPEQGYVTFFTNTDMSSSERMVVTAGDYVAAKVMANANADEYKRKECNNYKEYCEQEMNYNYYNQNVQNGVSDSYHYFVDTVIYDVPNCHPNILSFSPTHVNIERQW